MPGLAEYQSGAVEMSRTSQAWQAYKFRWKRRRYLFRALRKRRQLASISDNTAKIKSGDILCFCTVRNEVQRLPFFLDHYRALGVAHFLFVDNASNDGTSEYLKQHSDVSLWNTEHSYKLSRFGVDWLTWLQIKYGHAHWCLTVDADEILVYPHFQTRPLPALTNWLEQCERGSFGALMLDMYPKGGLGDHSYSAGENPFDTLCWFDRGNYVIQKKPDLMNLWIQGGVRARAFFASRPRRAPTMSKIPLVRWNRRYAYVSSTHSLLPRKLNLVYDDQGGEKTSGVLLHSKFLDSVIAKSAEEKERQEHFANSSLYDGYYNALMENPDLWCEHSTKLKSWRQLEALGLMSKGGWV